MKLISIIIFTTHIQSHIAIWLFKQDLFYLFVYVSFVFILIVKRLLVINLGYIKVIIRSASIVLRMLSDVAKEFIFNTQWG